MDSPPMDVMARMSQRIDRMERDNRRWKRLHALLLVGTAVLLIGGIDRPTALEAQQVDREDEALSAPRSWPRPGRRWPSGP